jgi:hypothetical protein
MVHFKRFLCVFIKLSHKYFAEVAEQLKKKERIKYGNEFLHDGTTSTLAPRRMETAGTRWGDSTGVSPDPLFRRHLRYLPRPPPLPRLQFPTTGLSPALSYLPRGRARPLLAPSLQCCTAADGVHSSPLSRSRPHICARALNFPHQRLLSPACAQIAWATWPQFQTLASCPPPTNPLRPPTSSSRRRKTRQIRGAAPALASRSPTIDQAPGTPADGSSLAANIPVAVAAAASPTLPSLQATGFPQWWNRSSPMGSSEGYVYLWK